MDNFKGAILMVLAMAGFATEDAFVKLTSQTIPMGELMILLGLGGAGVFGIMAKARGLRLFGPELFSRPVLLRNAGEIVATFLFILSLTLIPLSLLSALIQANPLFVTLGAILFMGEKVGWRRWAAIIVGLIGVLVILRPGMSDFDPNALFGLIAAVALAVRDLATRSVPGKIHSLQLGFWGFSMVFPAGIFQLAITGDPVMPGPREAIYMIAAIGFGVAAYYAIISAMRVGEVGAVTPFRYTRLVFALILAFLIFDERPDAMMLIGAAIVVASGLYTLLRERALRRADLRRARAAAGPGPAG